MEEDRRGEKQTGMEDVEIKMEKEGTGETAAADEGSSGQQKVVRKRKKRLLSQITKQMEFYFCAANVTKDRFMFSLLEANPYIPLITFFKFNRIRSLTTDVHLLRTAIKKSSILELSQDEEMVCSKIDIQVKTNEIECTIYAENIPMHADHEWVHQMFTQYGTIDYISLPRFSHSGRPKGFVFVEFGTPEMANLALEAFGSLDCRISASLDPGHLLSIKTFTGEEEAGEMEEGPWKEKESMEEGTMEGEGKEKVIVKEDEDEGKEKVKVEEEEVKEGKKKYAKMDSSSRRGTDSEGDKVGLKRKLDDVNETTKAVKNVDVNLEEPESGTVPKRKCIIDDNQKESGNKKNGEAKNSRSVEKRELEKENENTFSEKTHDRKDKKRKLDENGKQGSEKRKKRRELKGKGEKAIEEVEQVENDTTKTGNTDNPASGKKKKKKRKRIKKEKEEDVDSMYLQVMSKADWKKLRNKYLNAQRENMRALKRELQERYQYNSYHSKAPQNWHTRSYSFTDTDYSQETHEYQSRTGSDSSNNPVTLDHQSTTESEASKAQSTQPQFIPNTIVKISFEEPPQDPKKLREAIRNVGGGVSDVGGGVAYVDVSATERDVFVRFHSVEAATAYKKTGCWSRMEMLTGTEEEEYWSHINKCWAQRRTKRTSKAKGGEASGGHVKGREKLLGKAVREAQNTKPNSHIIFED